MPLTNHQSMPPPSQSLHENATCSTCKLNEGTVGGSPAASAHVRSSAATSQVGWRAHVPTALCRLSRRLPKPSSRGCAPSSRSCCTGWRCLLPATRAVSRRSAFRFASTCQRAQRLYHF